MTLRQQPLYHDRRIAGFWATVRVGATVEIDDQAWLDALRKGELVGTCRTCGGYLIPGIAVHRRRLMAGSWCADQLTDGWVPEDIAEMLAPKHWRRWAAKLVEVGLWVAEERAGHHGWRFHDWSEYQPSRSQVLAERKAASERQQRARERARLSRGSHGVTDTVTHGGRHGPPDPTRPDPTTTTHGPSAPQGRTAHGRAEEPPPSDAEPSRVEKLITEYRDNSPRGVPSRQAEKLAVEIHTLIRDGYTDNEIRHGLGQLRVRKLGPTMLPGLVDELANTLPNANVIPITAAGVRPSTTDQRVANTLALGARLQAEAERNELGG
jgi:hypothetical protein